jgi:hypothetical protein
MANTFSLPPDQPNKHRRARWRPQDARGASRPVRFATLAALALALAPSAMAPSVASAAPTCTTTRGHHEMYLQLHRGSRDAHPAHGR